MCACIYTFVALARIMCKGGFGDGNDVVTTAKGECPIEFIYKYVCTCVHMYACVHVYIPIYLYSHSQDSGRKAGLTMKTTS